MQPEGPKITVRPQPDREPYTILWSQQYVPNIL
jgi:hypothetical protein